VDFTILSYDYAVILQHQFNPKQTHEKKSFHSSLPPRWPSGRSDVQARRKSNTIGDVDDGQL